MRSKQLKKAEEALESIAAGVLTISLPKSDKPREGVKRIAINTY